MHRLILGSIAGLVWVESTVLPWLWPAVQRHLTAEPIPAFGLAAGAAWLYGGMYVAAFALVYPWLSHPRWLSAPALWVLMEWVRARAFDGAPWALLGHALHSCLPLAQVAEWTGVSGLSALALLPAVALAESGRERRLGLGVAGLAIVAGTILGALRLATPLPPDGPVVLRVVGGHHGDPDPLAAYVAASTATPDAALTIWPESALADYLQESPALAARVGAVARVRGWLLVGGPRYDGAPAARHYFNSALLLDPDGRFVGAYDKSRLVPFAERSPWPFASLVERPFTPGGEPARPLAAGRLRIGPLVCWDAVFPELARQHALHGAHVLVNLTSDRDLGRGAEQALAFARFRAIETRRWLVRASGFGPTLMIDPFGRVLSRTTLGVDPDAEPDPTFYVRHGEIGPGIALAYLIFLPAVRTFVRSSARRRVRG